MNPVTREDRLAIISDAWQLSGEGEPVPPGPARPIEFVYGPPTRPGQMTIEYDQKRWLLIAKGYGKDLGTPLVEKVFRISQWGG